MPSRPDTFAPLHFVVLLVAGWLHLAGISADAHGAWMAQLARNLTDCVEGFLAGKTKLIVDRDPLYTEHFRALLRDAGVELVRLPARSPNLNAFAERFVRSIKSECLSKVIPLGEAHLRSVLAEYMAHYHSERNHQGLGNVIPFPATTRATAGAVKRRDRLGGLLKYHYRDAA